MIRKALLGIVIATGLSGPVFAGDPVVDFSADDPVKQAAVKEARNTLPVFLRKTLEGRDQSEQGASLKVEVVINNDLSEIIWVAPFARAKGGGFLGVLANAPVHMTNHQAGDTIRFAQHDIQDWSWMENDRLYGNYVTRIMVPHLSAENQAWLKETLSDSPLPSGW